jgi:hypothetical protein
MTNYSIHDNTDRYALDHLTTNSLNTENKARKTNTVNITRKLQSHERPEVLVFCFMTMNHKKLKSTRNAVVKVIGMNTEHLNI